MEVIDYDRRYRRFDHGNKGFHIEPWGEQLADTAVRKGLFFKAVRYNSLKTTKMYKRSAKKNQV
uniref:Uncharacterized protein n=1 Tax=Solanum lycopersicum TaxID=4081 RepID=A0A3Q7HBP8_SOLLC